MNPYANCYGIPIAHFFFEGYSAFHAGYGVDQNPYTEQEIHVSWEEGWLHAKTLAAQTHREETPSEAIVST